jgi:ABC-2 type transport system ATP-binding protein
MVSMNVRPVDRDPVDGAAPSDRPPITPAIEIRELRRKFGEKQALDGVSLDVAHGEIHALLGPNGAGKTTLLRILTGLVEPDSGEIKVHGIPVSEIGDRRYRAMLGLVPSGDRSLYLRITGFENMLFFARLHGLSKRAARARANELIKAVGLEDAAHKPVGIYSHGMQKRLSVARALLGDPVVLFVDEATHDLDPEGARRVQDLVVEAAARGAAAIWTTQRLEEVRGFADAVTLIDHGTVRFAGSVPQLLAVATPRRYLVQIDAARAPLHAGVLEIGNAAVGDSASLLASTDGDPNHYVLVLGEDVVLGAVLSALHVAGLPINTCTEERSGLEHAFMHLVSGKTPS